MRNYNSTVQVNIIMDNWILVWVPAPSGTQTDSAVKRVGGAHMNVLYLESLLEVELWGRGWINMCK